MGKSYQSFPARWIPRGIHDNAWKTLSTALEALAGNQTVNRLSIIERTGAILWDTGSVKSSDDPLEVFNRRRDNLTPADLRQLADTQLRLDMLTHHVQLDVEARTAAADLHQQVTMALEQTWLSDSPVG